jgi:hypothetical protein
LKIIFTSTCKNSPLHCFGGFCLISFCVLFRKTSIFSDILRLQSDGLLLPTPSPGRGRYLFSYSSDYLAFSYVISIPVGRLFIQKFCDDIVLTDMDIEVRRISVITRVCELYLTYPITFQKYVYGS